MLNTDFIHPFLNATVHILNVQANLPAEAGKAYLKKQNDRLIGDVSGIISVVSDKFNGSVVISFPEGTFLKIMSSMLGEEFSEISPEIVDGAGEILNMIFGQAKIVLNEKGYGIKTAIPSVVTGRALSVSTMTKGPVVVVPFQSQAGDFFVEICLNH
jgi:chemotaxis protein CheX